MQQKELLENLAALKIQVCYRSYRGRCMSAKLRENLVIDLRTRLDEETKKRMEYEIKINAFEEEKRQIAEDAEGEDGSAPDPNNAAMRALQAQIVALQNALDEQVAESSSLREEADSAKDDARSAAAETLALRDKITDLERNANESAKNRVAAVVDDGRTRSGSLSRGDGASKMDSPPKVRASLREMRGLGPFVP